MIGRLLNRLSKDTFNIDSIFPNAIGSFISITIAAISQIISFSLLGGYFVYIPIFIYIFYCFYLFSLYIRPLREITRFGNKILMKKKYINYNFQI